MQAIQTAVYDTMQKPLAGLETFLQKSHGILGQHQVRSLDDVVHVGSLDERRPRNEGGGTVKCLDPFRGGLKSFQ